MPSITLDPIPGFSGIIAIAAKPMSYEVLYVNGTPSTARDRNGSVVSDPIVDGEFHISKHFGKKLGTVCLDCGGRCKTIRDTAQLSALVADLDTMNVVIRDCDDAKKRKQKEAKEEAAQLSEVKRKRAAIKRALSDY
jgi:ethanolamine utilization protein EutA (predicted chaperonin)